jgi:hypothetical protein
VRGEPRCDVGVTITETNCRVAHAGEGAQIDAVEVFVSGSGYGLRTTRDVAKGELVCIVNSSLALSERTAARSSVMPIIREMYADHRRWHYVR